MAYDISINVVAFQWKGESTDDMEVFHKTFPAVRFAQTPQHVLRVRYGDRCIEVPIGRYVIAPERSAQDIFMVDRHVWANASSGIGGINYVFDLSNVKMLLSQDYNSDTLERVLAEIDRRSFVEMQKSRFYCSGRYVGLESDQVLVYTSTFIFALRSAFCKEMSDAGKIVFRDKKVVIDDASIILIRTDATIIVDSQRECSIVRKDLSQYGATDSIITDFIDGKKMTAAYNGDETYVFKVSAGGKEATRVMLQFLQANKRTLSIDWTKDNKILMLRYITESINNMLARTSMLKARQTATHMRINKFEFDAMYKAETGEVALIKSGV